MKTLTLQITKKNFDLIASGAQKTETRAILPNTASRYVKQTETEEGTDVEVIEYDALYLINGRRKDAPRLTVKVEKCELVIPTDENGNDIVYTEKGEEYTSCWMAYRLGEVVSKENC